MSLKIAFVHPDLGIGGAERLVVDAAIGLQRSKNSIHMYTSHHNPSHCFQETRDGTLKVSVYGDFLPRHVLGMGSILFAMLRSIYLCFMLTFVLKPQVDVYIVDQISVGIPILKLTGAKILFYCHYPDMLLTTRKSFLKRLYRLPFDYIEELTTSMADEIVVNSKFTAGVFQKSFKSIQKAPAVLYPGIDTKSYNRKVDHNDPLVKALNTDKRMILSVNRFERKKNISLAVHAFGQLKERNSKLFPTLRLVIAGGHDPRVKENVEYLAELKDLAENSYGLTTYTLDAKKSFSDTIPTNAQVLFLLSFTEAQRTFLFEKASCLVYTPSEEHFGIVPVEAMYAGLPVIAVASGGPTESIIDGQTGFLVQPTPTDFAKRILDTLESPRLPSLKERLQSHVESKFSLNVFTVQLGSILTDLAQKPTRPTSWPSLLHLSLITVGVVGLSAYVFHRGG